MGLRGGVKVVFAVALLARVAAADAQACISQSEQAQQARSDGHFTTARDLFHACAAAECPSAVRADCERSFDEVGRAMPSVVFVVRRGGRDVTNARVSVDGAELVGALEGRSVPLDPGRHHVRVVGAGGERIDEQDVVIHEGEKNRLLEFDAPAEQQAIVSPPPPPVRKRGHTAGPWVVTLLGVGAAVAGGVLVAAGQTQYGGALDGCTVNVATGTYTCPVRPGYTSQQASDASRTADQQNGSMLRGVGIVTGAVGIAAIIGGLVWHFVEPTGPVSASAWAAPTGAGVQVRLAF